MAAANQWPMKRLRDITSKIGSGATPRGGKNSYKTQGISLIRSLNVYDFSFNEADLAFIDNEQAAELDNVVVERDDILLNITGASVARCCMVSPKYLPARVNQHVAIVRIRPDEADARFVLYCINSPHLKSSLLTLAQGGATREALTKTTIENFEVPQPPLPVQQGVSGILSAYDDLTENSLRRVRILEAMARALYREWFVHFRYPGHEKFPLVASCLGEIPESWQIKRVPECVYVNPRVIVPRNGEKPFVPMSCLSNDSMLISDIESRDGNSGAKFQNGDTLFARITPCLENGKTGFVQFMPDADAVACGSTEFIVLRSRTLTPEFVYCLARSDDFRGVAIKSMSGATGRQRVQEQCFDDFQIAHPPRALLDRFSAIVAPGFRLIHKLHLQIQNLRQTRDLLLPRLLSGQVELP
jgi:type I restriction enzyme S subunit